MIYTNSARAAIDRTQGRIRLAEQGKNSILRIKNQLDESYKNKEISYAQYLWEHEKKIDGQTISEWLNYYENYVRYCNAEIRKYKKIISKNKTLKVFSSLFALSIILWSGFYIGPAMVGFVIQDNDSENFTGVIDEEIILGDITDEVEEIPILEDETEITDENITFEEPLNISPEEQNISEIITNETILVDNATIELNESLEELNITTPEENITVPEENITAVVEGVTITTTQLPAVLGQPVQWIKQITLDEVKKINVELPKSATKVLVKKIKEDKEAKFSITGGVISDVGTDNFITRFFKNLLNFFGKIFSTITGQVVQDIEEEINQTLEIDDTATEYELTYETPAPYSTEEKTKKGKKVKITGPKKLVYGDVLTFTELDENLNVKNPFSVKIYWVEEDKYIPIQKIEDKNDNGIYDYIEWISPNSDSQTFEIIVIIKAEHLDENREFISDIYDEVSQLDSIWSETIPEEHHIRITFEIPLDSSRDITIYPRVVSGTPKVQIYEVNDTELIAEFTTINSDEYNKIYLTNLQGTQDTFDLKVIDGEIEFDHIIDPITNGTSATGNTDALSDGMTWDYNFTCGEDMILIVGVAIDQDASPNIDSITYNGTPMSRVGYEDSSDSEEQVEMWNLSNPDCGASLPVNVTFTNKNAEEATGGSVVFYGVDSVNLSTVTTLGCVGASCTSSSITVPAKSGDVVVDVIAVDRDPLLTYGGNQTELINYDAGEDVIGMSYGDVTEDSLTMTWTWANDEHAHIGVALIPSIAVEWNQSSLDLGESTNNITSVLEIESTKTNTNVTLTCTGNCTQITTNWTQRTMSNGQSDEVLITCSNATQGTFQAVFNVTSDEDTSNNSLTVDCEIFSYGWLNVSISKPDDDSVYSTGDTNLTINATVTCEGGSNAKCGNVSGLARYNLTTNPDTDINITKDGEPFYISGTSEVYQDDANATSCGGDWSATYPCSDTYDGNWDSYGDTIVYSEGMHYFNYSKPTGVLGAKLEQKSGNGQSNSTVPSACWALDPLQFYLRLSRPAAMRLVGWYCYNATGSQISLKSDNNGAYEYRLIWTVAEEEGENPKTSPSSLSQGQSWNVSWELNVTTVLKEIYLIDVLFNSSHGNSSIQENSTEDRTVNLNPSGEPPDTTYPTFSNYWDDNATFNDSGTGHFNVTVENTNGTVLLEINGNNITATNLSFNIYNVSHTFSSGGTYPYKWHSWGNGTSEKYNVSEERNYIINSTGPFKFHINTTGSPETFSFQTDNALNLFVDWGDGNNDTYNGTGLRSYEYASAGDYNISLTGYVNRVSFYEGTEDLLNDILTPMSNSLTGINSSYQMFRDASGITTFTAEDWFDDVSGEVTNMSWMFAYTNTFNQPLNNWNTSSVTDMSLMFAFTYAFNGNISNWNTSSVTNMYAVFYHAIAFNQPLNNWNTSSVTSMSYMFDWANAFNQPLNNWDTSKIPSMYAMFNNASVFDQDLGNWNVSAVTDMTYMFAEVNLSTPNYNSLLIGWAGLTPNLKNGVTFYGANLKYSSVATSARNDTLIGDHSWLIYDGGYIDMDTTYPQFSNYQDNNATLEGSGTGWFNVTLENTNGTVLLEINGTNITATNLSFNIYNASHIFSADGTYLYKWYSWGNGTSENPNSSIERDYVVNTSANTPPQIISVESISSQTPLEGNVRNVTFNFTVNDTDGATDLNSSTAQARFQKDGETTRLNTSCVELSASGNEANYSCTVGMLYFDDAGNWTINVTIQDDSGESAENSSTNFTYELLTAMVMSPTALEWGTINLTDTDIPSTSHPIVINNTGNKESLNISVRGYDLQGAEVTTDYIYAHNFTVDNATDGCSGNTMSNATNVTILSAILERGNNTLNLANATSGQEQLYFCLKGVPSDINTQDYSSEALSWTIRIFLVLFVPAGRKKKGIIKLDKDVVESVSSILNTIRKRHDLGKLEVVELLVKWTKGKESYEGDKLAGAACLILESTMEEYGLNSFEILNAFVEEIRKKYRISRKAIRNIEGMKAVSIPIAIFSEKIGGLEAITKYMRENLRMSYSEIGLELKRDQRTIWSSYNRAIAKNDEFLEVSDDDTCVPITILENRNLTVLESLVSYLHENKMKYSEIGKMLNRDQRNIWTISSRAMKKINVKQ
ncbi:DUF285 domain-containing protein [Candidatus Pacearchaeota archaeon]|nr:DUF285 domain-containing protein [Candidatus Pacearchaeota archaeon]